MWGVVVCKLLTELKVSFTDYVYRILIESGALPGSALFRLYFKTTKDYLDLTERVILAGKIQGEAYELRTVINQAILDGKKIMVRSWEDLP